MAAVAGATGSQALGALAPLATDAGSRDLEWVKSVCRFCGTGCGVVLGVRDGKLVSLRGDQKHPTTKGLVCAKALFLPKIVRSENRLKTPMIRKGDKMVEASWEDAMTLVAEKFAGAIKKGGPDAVAYYGSGQALSEESYLANRMFKGGIGTNNVEGNPRLCMASAVGGYVTSYGKDEPMGCYDDIEATDAFVLWGSNMAEMHPILWTRVTDRRLSTSHVEVAVLSTFRHRCFDLADIDLIFTPQTDLAILNYIANYIISNDKANHDSANKRCNGKTKRIQGCGSKIRTS